MLQCHLVLGGLRWF